MKFEAVVRTELGKGASRRLRHAGKFPAVVYGGEEAAVSIVLNHDDIVNQMDKPEFYHPVHQSLHRAGLISETDFQELTSMLPH